MARPLLVSCGSRGDVEPVFSMASALAARSSVDYVTLVIPTDQASLAPLTTLKLRVFTFEFDLSECWRHLPSFNADVGGTDTAVFQPELELRVLGPLLRGMIFPHAKRIASIAEETRCNVILSGFMTIPVAHIIAQRSSIPLIWLQLQPIMPSMYYPHILLDSAGAADAMCTILAGDPEKMRSDTNLSLHHKSIDLIFTSVLNDLNTTRSSFGLPSISVRNLIDLYAGKAENTHLFITLPSQIFPRTPDMPSNAHIVGPVASSYMPESWVAQKKHPDLCNFLETGPKPVVISYGSMDAQGVAASLTKSLLSGLRSAGVQRVVMIPGNAGLSIDFISDEDELVAWARKNVFVTVGNVQYAWLLPRSDAIMCHCGAGTISAALAAGVPILGTPVISDQMFFAQLICRLKLGVRVGSMGLPSITAKSVENCIRAVHKAEVRDAVRSFAANFETRDESVLKACCIVENIVAKS